MKKTTTTPSIPKEDETFTLTQDGETLTFEGNSTSCMNDYVSSKEPEETETFFDWCKNSYPYIPIQEGDKEDIQGHTPGEWKAVDTKGIIYPFEITNNEGILIAKTIWGTKVNVPETWEEIAANAKLIASAPQLKAENTLLKEQNKELFEALVGLYRSIDDKLISFRFGDEIGRAKAAIEKANQ